MDLIDFPKAMEIALDSLLSDRLAILCGAGLSMSAPSNIPSAADLASVAKKKYDAMYGVNRSPLAHDIEKQAEFFFKRGELGTIYLRTLIDQHAFSVPPNLGHFAIADLMLVRAIQTAASTNVDSLIEVAGAELFGRIGAAIDRDRIAMLPPGTSPLLKIHGCWSQDQRNTVWAKGQLDDEPVKGRIERSKEWLKNQLLDRDLLIVGYWTDWDYLNEVLDITLGQVEPARVLVINPSETADLVGKAPALHALGSRAKNKFFSHVRTLGDTFLNQLRIGYSLSFIRRVLHAGEDSLRHETGMDADSAWFEPVPADAQTLWLIRRDLEGCNPNAPATMRAPPSEPLLGLTLLQLQKAGAVPDGPYWALATERIRVLRTPGTLLGLGERSYAHETPPTTAPTVVIAVGAESSSLPGHIVRSGVAPSITRGGGPRWLTRADAITEFRL